MALPLHKQASSIVYYIALLALISLFNSCSCSEYKRLNYSDAPSSWGPASVTWYGAPTGAGPDDNGNIYISVCVCIFSLICSIFEVEMVCKERIFFFFFILHCGCINRSYVRS